MMCIMCDLIADLRSNTLVNDTKLPRTFREAIATQVLHGAFFVVGTLQEHDLLNDDAFDPDEYRECIVKQMELLQSLGIDEYLRLYFDDKGENHHATGTTTH